MRWDVRETAERGLEAAARAVRESAAGYGGGPEMPLGGYAALLGTYPVLLLGIIAAARRRGRDPDRPGLADLLLLGVAVHKTARILTKDWVTAPVRAPFTEYVESAGAGEVVERSRGAGLRRAMGDLLTCAYCSAAWLAMLFTGAFLFAPRATRFIAGIFTVEAISDGLNIAYEAGRKARK